MNGSHSDDDDLWAPSKLATQLEAVAGDPGDPAWVCACAVTLDCCIAAALAVAV